MMQSNVSILAEIPEALHESLKIYLEKHTDWDQDRVFAAALSLFLLQNGGTDRRATQVYLDALFRHPVSQVG
jgi:predicted TPR repeat methyltransferase